MDNIRKVLSIFNKKEKWRLVVLIIVIVIGSLMD